MLKIQYIVLAIYANLHPPILCGLQCVYAVFTKMFILLWDNLKPWSINLWKYCHRKCFLNRDIAVTYLNFRIRAWFEQGVPWHSRNYRRFQPALLNLLHGIPLNAPKIFKKWWIHNYIAKFILNWDELFKVHIVLPWYPISTRVNYQSFSNGFNCIDSWAMLSDGFSQLCLMCCMPFL